MGIATFNSILHHMRNRNADSTDDDIFEDELHNTIRRLNFAEEQNEAKAILSDLQSMAEIQKNCLVEYVLLDFVMGKGCTECSKAVCEDAFGKHPTFADMMRHPWFKHLMSHPVATEPYSPLPPIVRNDAYYWHSFHFPLFYYLQEGNSLALEVLDYLATKGDIPSMKRVSLYYFDKCQFSKA